MKIFNKGLLVVTAAIATSLHAQAGSSLSISTSSSVSDNLAPSIYQSADAGSLVDSLSLASKTSGLVGSGVTGYPTESLKTPEPSTLALSTFGGLATLLFLRRFGKGVKTQKA